MTLFVLVTEGYFDGYGSRTYLLGVFDNMADVEKAKANYINIVKNSDGFDADDLEYYVTVHEVDLNTEYPLKKADSVWSDNIYDNCFCVGSYCE